jgi:hypothetical protein
MDNLGNFIHTEWNDICIFNPIRSTIKRKYIDDEEGKYYIKDDKVIINWYKWPGDDVFIKINDNYYQEVLFNDNTYNFIHNEWSDQCFLDNKNFIIKRVSCKDELGTFKLIDNILTVNWEKWEGDDIFIKDGDYFYQKTFFDKFVNYDNIIEFTLINEKKEEFYLNEEKKLIFRKNKPSKYGNYRVSDNNFNFTIDWDEGYTEIFVKINETYYEKNHAYKNNLFSIIKKKDIFKKIDGKYYSQTFLNNKKKYVHKVFDYDFNDKSINIKLKKLIEENDLLNKNYLSIDKINNHLNNHDFIDNFSYLSELTLEFEIPPKDNSKRRNLSLLQWGYPPFGGGEDWMLNFNKILSDNDYDNYLICFSDPFKDEYFTKINFIDLSYVKIIQMPKDLIQILLMVRIINPDIITHQGIERELFMKISNILDIPFFTGFCFWQNIIKFNTDNINVDMLNNKNLERTEEFHQILENSYTYASSEFVNDVIDHFYNLKLDVIETISLKENFSIEGNFTLDKNKYVTLINCHHNKGGYLLKYLFENLDIEIPLLIINTENDPIINIEYLKKLVKERNLKNNVNQLIYEKTDIKVIYEKTQILLIPSICEETFCRVAYEGMLNKIPILSTSNGNLKYLLKDYAIFINQNDYDQWKYNIENIYNNKDLIKEIQQKENKYINYEIIENKIINKLNDIKESKYKLSDKNIGLIIPWADQGLGIQGREYYFSLKENGYNPYILSFRPYHATYDNLLLQSDNNEWKYDNITYSDNYRENLTYDEIFHFVYKNKIKKIIIIEASFIHIFKIALFLKLINVKVYLVVNIECIRMVELTYHNIFDKILTNNDESDKIIKSLFDKSQFLGFHLNHPYFQEFKKKSNSHFQINDINDDNNIKKEKKIKFCCMGGLNSITRKNINVVISAFYTIFKENLYNNWELNVYIQGVEIPQIINNYNCSNINYHINNLSYKSIIESYYNNDIFIHMGSHEGLGLGFFESLYIGLPILTMDWSPNNEIIKDNVNGWIVKCVPSQIYDNDNSLLNKGFIYEEDLKDKLIEILSNEDKTFEIINNTINNIDNLSNENKIAFNKNLNFFIS